MAVPTPFHHIVLAQDLLDGGRLPQAVRTELRAVRPAFLFGSTAPDFGSMAGKRRAATHFFHVPLRPGPPAHLSLLEEHPSLAHADQLSASHAAFVAGYLAHLWLDQAWIYGVFEPHFGPAVNRGRFRQRLIAHNLLRADLELEQRERLPPDTSTALRQAKPRDWLPFGRDADLVRWRDRLAEQVEPGGRVRTVDVFAQRLNMPAEAFADRLHSQAEMQRTVYSHLPANLLDKFERLGLDGMAELVQYYWEGRLDEAPNINQPLARQAPGTNRTFFGSRP